MFISLISCKKSPPAYTPPADDDDYCLEQILYDLSGHWEGAGFTMIAVPSLDPNSSGDFDLKTFRTSESLLYSGVRTHIRNGGDVDEFFLSAVTYYQTVTDSTSHVELHVEPGAWIWQPVTGTADVDRLWRAGVVYHGNSFLAGSLEVSIDNNGPVFEDIDATPFNQSKEEERRTGKYVLPYKDLNLIPPSMLSYYDCENIILNPVEVLKQDIKGQNILKTKTIKISSVEEGPALGGILNIPTLNAELTTHAAQIEATFYIEKVKEGDSYFWQLQYVQEIYLDFPVFRSKNPKSVIITWPHISVGTLRQIAGEKKPKKDY